ncbi:MAG: hypothetical protein IJW17_06520, partial [Lentisphaeria bacterium]|nr:hypothetical protein [Lentisphaeria bacterium]
ENKIVADEEVEATTAKIALAALKYGMKAFETASSAASVRRITAKKSRRAPLRFRGSSVADEWTYSISSIYWNVMSPESGSPS